MKRILLLTLVGVLTLSTLAQKYVGGDISMLKEFIDKGAVYKDKDGNIVEPIAFFKQQGWNAMRVRLFVDPTKATEKEKREGVIQDMAYVKALGRSIKEAGLSFMLDFHYSDTWTHPGQHATPSAWSNMTVAEKTAQIALYTKECLEELKAAGATPDIIQTGNEISDGMLYPSGRVYAGGDAPTGGSWANLAGYLASAIKACKGVCPNAKIVIHTELHAPNNVPKFYNTLAQYTDVKFDIIGLSYYPDYHGELSVLDNVLTTLECQHPDKQIMIVETGYGFKWQISGATKNLTDTYPTTEEGQKKFTIDLIKLLNQHQNVNGLYWWYPEYTLNNIVFVNGSENWGQNFTNGYWNGALFQYKTGKALPALYELTTFLNNDTGILNTHANTNKTTPDTH